jgi:hypothetical protein
MASDRKDIPLFESHCWRSASHLARRFVGSQPSIANRMLELRRALIADVEAIGLSAEDAEALINNHLIRMQMERSGKEQPTASQEAVSLLGLVERAQVVPNPPEGWISSFQFGHKHRIGERQVNGMAVRLYRENVELLQQAGYSEKDARKAVDESFARQVRSTEGRRRVWHLSPSAIDQMRALRTKTTNSAELPEETGWQRRWIVLLRSLIADMTRNGFSKPELTEAIQNFLASELATTVEDPAKGRR